MTLTPALSAPDRAAAPIPAPHDPAHPAGHAHASAPDKAHAATHAAGHAAGHAATRAHRPAPRLGLSLLRLSLASRLIIAGALLAPLWIAVILVVG